MERKILFKAKRLDNAEWVEGDLLHRDGKTYIYGSYIDESGVYIEDMPVDPSAVCQFTGLKDKDGKEVWEHDILKNYPMTNEVIFSNGVFMIIEDYDDDIVEVPLSNLVTEENTCCLEVIGNKFDRKEGEK